MKNDKNHPLDGKHNQRLKHTIETHSEITEARSNIQKQVNHTHVNVPSSNNITNAKEWVDNGSRL